MIKRMIDLLGAITGLLMLSPLLIVIAFLIKKKIGSPIIFAQKRPGQAGIPFTFYKFRTMTNETDANGIFLRDSDRLIPFGQFLRKMSLDELPSLFNVLRGDISLVGPRPLLVEYLDLYTAEQARRHEVKPGITGWAQVNGRNAISWEEKFNLDVWYVDNYSIFIDIKILFLTIIRVIKRDGIYTKNSETMPTFQGKSK
jgi:sugar transferase EpsL